MRGSAEARCPQTLTPEIRGGLDIGLSDHGKWRCVADAEKHRDIRAVGNQTYESRRRISGDLDLAGGEHLTDQRPAHDENQLNIDTVFLEYLFISADPQRRVMGSRRGHGELELG